MLLFRCIRVAIKQTKKKRSHWLEMTFTLSNVCVCECYGRIDLWASYNLCGATR